ncbi:MAG: hypothetical protein H0V17_34530 [Deltaproteobacteria bacterium]|nr:hypothetical protein [Deltaproteobacteria bacterium]
MLRLVALIGLLAACGKGDPKRELDLDRIEVLGANMRTDTVGGGDFAETATFVLVDAKNLANEGAYVTLGGELVDASGMKISDLSPQSLWIPAGEIRTYALVDTERKARPTAKTARAKVRGASVFPPPLARIEDVHTFDDHGQMVVQAYLVNDAPGDGVIMVVATFHDERGRPVTRPFNVVKIKGKQGPATVGDCRDAAIDRDAEFSKCPIQFVGPAGAKTATMFVADTIY